MAKLSLRDALNTSLTRTKQYIDTELAKKANSSHGTHVTYGGNGSATTVSRSDHTHSYLPLSGGQVTGKVYLTTGATSTDASHPTQLAYGLLGSYGNLKVLGNTDTSAGADTEYVHIAAGWGLDPAVNKGIVVRGTYAECFGGTIRPQYSKTINLTASTYNVNTWYPCVPATSIPYRGLHRINLAVQLNSGSKPSWSTHDAGFTCNIDVLATAGGWGTTSAYSICLQDYYSFTNNRPAGYQQLGNSSKPLFYLRGGGIYTIYTDYDTGAWTIYTASTTMNDETFAPTTTAPGVSINRSTVFTNISGNASSASKLETARTLTIGNAGKSFNGSGNISWTLAEIGAAPASHGTHLTLGTGSGNAFRGDYGNTAYQHSQAAHAPSNAQKNSDITKAEIEAKLTGSISSHNHTSLTGVTSLTFAANADDSSVIKITKDSATSYTDFVMSDDAGSDMWRWRFKAWDSSTSAETAEFNLMTLKATSTTKGQLNINGNVTADSFTENGTALSNKYAPKSHGTHLTIGTGASNAAAGNHTHNYAGSSSAGGAADSAKACTGNAATATKFASSQSVALTGDVTGSASSQAGWSIATTLKNSGVTAGSYGPSANASPSHGGTFSVPYITVDAKGRVTAASTKTITIPSDITTFTKSLKLTTSWMDVGISGTNLSTGTYAVQVFGDFAGQGSLWTEYFSGIMSWYSGGTNSTDADEISLHSCGHATNGNALYLRTLRQSNSSVVKLQIATDLAFTAAVSITFKFKKLI